MRTITCFLVLMIAIGCVVGYEQPIDHQLKGSIEFVEHLNKLSDLTENCPPQPTPVHIDQNLPDGINTALNTVVSQMSDFFNTSVLGSMRGSILIGNRPVISFGFGQISEKNPVAPTDDTIYRIGSCTKTFVAIAALQAEEAGVIDLDDELTTTFPKLSFINPFNTKDGVVTWRQVLTQNSGLPREAPCNYTLFCNKTMEEMLENLKGTILDRLPNTRPSYSNLGFALTGNILSILMKEDSFGSLAKSAIFDRLKMSNTGFDFTADVIAKMATGYLAKGVPTPMYTLGWNSPAGEAYSSIGDLNTFIGTFLEGFRGEDTPILSSEAIKEMLKASWFNADFSSGFGMPFEMFTSNNYEVMLKGGNVPGFSALISTAPKLNIGVNILFASQADEFKAAKIAYDVLVPAFEKYYAANQPKVPQPPNPAAYVGEYGVVGAMSHTINITSVNGQLTLAGQPVSLVYHTKNLMKLEVPTTLLPCISSELSANYDTWMTVDWNADGSQVSAFQFPGIMARFARVE